MPGRLSALAGLVAAGFTAASAGTGVAVAGPSARPDVIPAVTAAGPLAPAPALALVARVKVSPPVVGAGGTLTVLGSGWPCRAAIDLVAYVDGVSPYGTVEIGAGRVSHGSFSERWRVPRVSDSLTWTVQAAQSCGGRTSVVTGLVYIAAAPEQAQLSLGRPGPVPVVAASAGATTLGPQGLQLIAGEEGYRLNKQGQYIVYNDNLGFCTAGYGHLLHKSGCTAADRAGPYNNLAPAQAVALLQKDANAVAAYVVGKVKVPLSQSELDALVSFTFNIGNPAFGGSTLLRLLNQGRRDQVPAQMARWVHGVVGTGKNKHSEVISGLVTRRAKESGIWAKGKFPPAQHPLPKGTGGPAPTTTTSPTKPAPSRPPKTTSTTPTPGTPTTATTTTVTTTTGTPTTSGVTTTTSASAYNVKVAVSGLLFTSADGRDLGSGYGTVTAVFTSPDGQRTVSLVPGDSEELQVVGGSVISLAATWEPSNYFVGWSSADCSASAPTCRFTVSSDTEVTANFGVPTYELTVDNQDMSDGYVASSDDGGGILCGDSQGTRCGPVQERSNVPVGLAFNSVVSDGVEHVVDSIDGCTPANALPAPGASCTIVPAKDTKITVTWGEAKAA